VGGQKKKKRKNFGKTSENQKGRPVCTRDRKKNMGKEAQAGRLTWLYPSCIIKDKKRRRKRAAIARLA
jgi:hypothetical protein